MCNIKASGRLKNTAKESSSLFSSLFQTRLDENSNLPSLTKYEGEISSRLNMAISLTQSTWHTNLKLRASMYHAYVLTQIGQSPVLWKKEELQINSEAKCYIKKEPMLHQEGKHYKLSLSLSLCIQSSHLSKSIKSEHSLGPNIFAYIAHMSGLRMRLS